MERRANRYRRWAPGFVRDSKGLSMILVTGAASPVAMADPNRTSFQSIRAEPLSARSPGA
jgi:hypothetical protein